MKRIEVYPQPDPRVPGDVERWQRQMIAANEPGALGPDRTPWPVRAAFALGILAALVFVLWFLGALWRAHAGVR